MPRLLRPLRRRGYRLLFLTLLAALLVEGMWMIAVVWQVIAMGGSATSLSTVSAAAALGLVGSALAGGVLADRVSQQRILFVLEVLKVVVLGALAGVILLGVVTIPLLMAGALVIGVVSGLYYPAYSALLPRLVAEDELLAVNGYESMVRPALSMAAGPALAGWLIALGDPGIALLVAAAACLAAAGAVAAIRPAELDGGLSTEAERQGVHPFRDLIEGMRYVAVTPWLLSTLLFASLLVFLVTGPIDVLIPFTIESRLHGDAGDHSLVLAAYGAGGVVGGFVMSVRRLPRRYLTAMVALWGLGALPLAVIGLARNTWTMAAAGFVLGVLFEAPVVVWGTLLQRRVPRRLLGRVSSLDFFVSLVFMPVSMAVAGPAGEAFGATTVFVVAAVVPLPLAVLAWAWARMRADELAHPLLAADDTLSPSVNAPPTAGTVG